MNAENIGATILDVGRFLGGSFLLCCVIGVVFAIVPERDFAGNWILVEERSNTRALGGEPEPFLKVTQDDSAIHCSTTVDGVEISWRYSLDCRDSRYRFAGESRNSAAKWEGAALLVNTLVSGAQTYTVMDRWRLSADRSILTITREVVRASGPVEGSLVYRRAGARPAAAPEPAPVLSRRPAAAPVAPGEVTVPAGTRVLLELVNSLNSKRSREGDHVYMRTAVPVSAHDRIVIPRGSAVNGTITTAKNARGKSDLYIRFDTLILPDGTTRDLRARPEGGKEGKVGAESDGGGDARKVATGAGIGASVGGIAGAASGHAGAGLGIGGLAGAAAGLASVFSSKQDVTLPQGTTVEMVLDRDLRF